MSDRWEFVSGCLRRSLEERGKPCRDAKSHRLSLRSRGLCSSMFAQAKPPRPVGRGAWERGPPQVRVGKMRLVEVSQLRRRRPMRPAAPSSATAPGAGIADTRRLLKKVEFWKSQSPVEPYWWYILT